jgi:hypothetical protein
MILQENQMFLQENQKTESFITCLINSFIELHLGIPNGITE